MPSSKRKRNYGLELQELGRKMGIHSILFHNAVAERLGLNITDHKCLEYMIGTEGITAGELAKVTGLTTGAITGVIDRLERAGFARRQPDPHDRRKVVVVAQQARLPEIGKLFESLSRNMGHAMSNYSPREYDVVIDFMQRVNDVMREENLKLRSHAPAANRNGKPQRSK
ncbi:MAG TPA: MarR family transcriptional regulator [Terriglobales bacterium]|nr:MarR family transcriptional regulator [Terriglobales bacterium]